MQVEIIRNKHDIGHFGAVKTEALVKQSYFITGLKDKIKNVSHNCVPYILANIKQGKQEFLRFLQSIDKGDGYLSYDGPLYM